MTRKLPTYLEFEEFKQLMAHTNRIDHKIGFLLGFGSGMRISEILGKESDKNNSIGIKPITKDNIDLKGKRIRIEGGKGGVDRVVPLPKGFKEYMLKELPLNKRYKSINSARRSFQRIFKKTAQRAGLLEKKPNLHYHSLRHSFGSRMANKGVPIHHIRTLMGHSNISTTNIYLVANPEKALDDYERLF